MILFEANVSTSLLTFFREILNNKPSIEETNTLLQEVCGIEAFFEKEEELFILQESLKDSVVTVEEPHRRAYGDFQTNEGLAQQITQYIQKKEIEPELIIEPTCGKGTFLLAALQQWTTIKKIIGIEIHLPYVWETKFSILELFLERKTLCKPIIQIIHQDIFEVDLQTLTKANKALELLVIGNPPWVTNAELGTLNSANLPKKSNFRGLKGLDAMTGKGNFDIGESIALKILSSFAHYTGHFAFLVKNTVVKNIVQEQITSNYPIGNLYQLDIDAKKEFNVSVNASLFFTQFNTPPVYVCQESDFYSQQPITQYGWHKDKFVYSISTYDAVKDLDGVSPFVWRQGMKHDCSKIMELNHSGEFYINGFQDETILEKELLFGLLKSADLKHEVVHSYRKTTIVTQKKIGQDTSYIKDQYPQTYSYLNKNRAYFERRKSSIYRGKPPFSIFGIGDYSFKQYKVAISGMYKRTTFSLVLPDEGKPLMLDDTCYFIGFDTLEEAKIAQKILNSTVVQSFLKAIIFSDAKRPITKTILMRINLEKAYHILSQEKEPYNQENWKAFGEKFNPQKENSNQMTLF